MPKRKERLYYVRSKSKNYQYGVFAHTKEGYEKAEKYVESLNTSKKEDFYISEK
jgi:hypothetical protein|tara:strand:+ start:1624 stop:1785 length:162 start_codon:yes stop_codon:yes gene_type:complete